MLKSNEMIIGEFQLPAGKAGLTLKKQ